MRNIRFNKIRKQILRGQEGLSFSSSNSYNYTYSQISGEKAPNLNGFTQQDIDSWVMQVNQAIDQQPNPYLKVKLLEEARQTNPFALSSLDKTTNYIPQSQDMLRGFSHPGDSIGTNFSSNQVKNAYKEKANLFQNIKFNRQNRKADQNIMSRINEPYIQKQQPTNNTASSQITSNLTPTINSTVDSSTDPVVNSIIEKQKQDQFNLNLNSDLETKPSEPILGKNSTDIKDNSTSELSIDPVQASIAQENTIDVAQQGMTSKTNRGSLLAGMEEKSYKGDPVVDVINNGKHNDYLSDIDNVTGYNDLKQQFAEDSKILTQELKEKDPTIGMKLSKEVQEAEGVVDSPESQEAKVLLGASGSSKGSRFQVSADKAATIGKMMTTGINLAQAGMYALGANANDSKGTMVARGVVDSAAEIASQLPPPANIAAPVLKGLNLADSILDKAHVGKYNDNFSMDKYTFEKVGGSYGSTLNAANEADRLSGQRHGFLGIGGRKARDRDNAKIAEAKRQQGIMAAIANENDDIKNGAEAMSDINHIHNSIFLNGGYNPIYARAAKEGGTLEVMDFEEYTDIPQVISFEDYLNAQQQISFEEYLNNIQQFKEGGELKSPNNIESDSNVIPEGALHKNKHNLKNVGFDDSEITKKGIPVVDENGNQQAEIELNEIIFSLEVTKFLEDNYHKFYDDSTKEKEKEELALNVGKELVFQILENTKDNTGLIQVAKDGGKLNN